MLRDFRPDQEELVDYRDSLTRIVAVLGVRGEPVDQSVITRFAIRAQYTQMVIGQDSENASKILRGQFTELLDAQQNAPDAEVRVAVLMDLLTSYGGGGGLLERVIARSAAGAVASGGGGGESSQPAASTPDKADQAGPTAGGRPGPPPGYEDRGAAEFSPYTPVRGPPPGMAGAAQPPAPAPSAVEAALLRQGEFIAKAFEKLSAKGDPSGVGD